MTAIVKDWIPSTVAATPVAPHRYTWDMPDPELVEGTPDDGVIGERARFLASVPYRAGEVVYVERVVYDAKAKEHNQVPILARILYVFVERNHYGDLREKYRVQLATKAGLWSKKWVYVWPGHVQRGYMLAGLAPDVTPSAMR